MDLLFITSEFAPFSRAGSLADVVPALASSLAKRGHAVCAVAPLQLPDRCPEARGLRPAGFELEIPLGHETERVAIAETVIDQVQIFLIGSDRLFRQDPIYAESDSIPLAPAKRFFCLSKAAIEIARRLSPPPQILHAHDWPGAPALALANGLHLPFRTVLSAHNHIFQGDLPAEAFALAGFAPAEFSSSPFEFFGRTNFLKAGLLAADRTILPGTLLPQTAQTPGGGHGLDGVFRAIAGRLAGIPDPLAPPLAPAEDSARALARRRVARALGRKTPLDGHPLLGISAEAAGSEGLALLLPVLRLVLGAPAVAILRGAIPAGATEEVMLLARQRPRQFRCDGAAARISLDDLWLAADLAVFPSQTDPDTQGIMRAIRQGTVPIAHAHGTLPETVIDYDPWDGSGRGIVFHGQGAHALEDALLRGIELVSAPQSRANLRMNGFSADFSADRCAAAHENLYRELLETRASA